MADDQPRLGATYSPMCVRLRERASEAGGRSLMPSFRVRIGALESCCRGRLRIWTIARVSLASLSRRGARGWRGTTPQTMRALHDDGAIPSLMFRGVQGGVGLAEQVVVGADERCGVRGRADAHADLIRRRRGMRVEAFTSATSAARWRALRPLAVEQERHDFLAAIARDELARTAVERTAHSRRDESQAIVARPDVRSDRCRA